MTNQAQLYKQINKGQIENGAALLKYANPESGESVLDIGCGTGELTFKLARKIEITGKVIGLDPDVDRVKLTASCLKSGGRFAIQFVYDHPECLKLIREMVNKPFEFPEKCSETVLGYFDIYLKIIKILIIKHSPWIFTLTYVCYVKVEI